MKLTLYIIGGFIATVAAALLITRGQAPDSNSIVLFAFVGLFAVPPFGAFWMMYMSIRHEKHPLTMVLLALVPFSFLWYYFERVRPSKLEKNRNLA